MLSCNLEMSETRLMDTDKWAGTTGVPEVSEHPPITINRKERGRLLVTNFPPAAAGQMPPCFPATNDPVGRVSPDHVVYAVAASEAEVNRKGFVLPSGVSCKVEG